MKGDDHERSNREAALLILRDIAGHGGPESGLVRWARLWMERHGAAEQERGGGRQPDGGPQLGLFSPEATAATETGGTR